MYDSAERLVSADEILKYCREATDIANFLRDSESPVVRVEAGDAWKYDTENGIIFFPPVDLPKSPDKRIVALGHEIGHLIYDTPEVFRILGEHPEARDNMAEAAVLMNAVRDLAVNDKLSARFVGFKDRVAKVYHEDLFPDSFFTEEAQRSLPPAEQFINGLIYQHYNNAKLPPFTEAEAAEAIKAIVKSKKLKMAINAYTPVLSYQRILSDIWPVYYKLFKGRPKVTPRPQPPGRGGSPDRGGQRGGGFPDNQSPDSKPEKEGKLPWRPGMKVREKATGQVGRIGKVNENGTVEVEFGKEQIKTLELKKVFNDPDNQLDYVAEEDGDSGQGHGAKEGEKDGGKKSGSGEKGDEGKKSSGEPGQNQEEHDGNQDGGEGQPGKKKGEGKKDGQGKGCGESVENPKKDAPGEKGGAGGQKGKETDKSDHRREKSGKGDSGDSGQDDSGSEQPGGQRSGVPGRQKSVKIGHWQESDWEKMKDKLKSRKKPPDKPYPDFDRSRWEKFKDRFKGGGKSYTEAEAQAIKEKTGLTMEQYRRYSELLREIAPYVRKLRDVFKPLFKPSDYEVEDGYLSGKMVDRKLSKLWTDARIFGKTRETEPASAAFSVVTDESGSMNDGDKAHWAALVTLLFGESLAGLPNVKYEVRGFQDNTYTHKKFNDNYSPKKGLEIITELRSQISRGGNTNDVAALQAALKEIKMQPFERKVIFFLTDGQGQDGMKEELEKLPRGVSVVGIGMGEGMGYVREIFPENITADSLPEMIMKISKKIRITIMRK